MSESTDHTPTLIRSTAFVIVAVALMAFASCNYSRYVVASSPDPLATACALSLEGSGSTASGNACLVSIARGMAAP